MTLAITIITALALLILGPAGLAFAGLSLALGHRRAGR